MNNFQKAFKDIQTFINRRRGGRKKEESEDDEANDGEEFNGDKEDEKPGDTKLNGGEHGNIFGINRKIVTGVIVTAFLIVSMATYTALNNHREQEEAKKAQPTMAAEEASDQQNSRKDNNGYDALFRQNQRAAGVKNGQNGQNPQNSNGTNGTNGNVTVARPQGNVTVSTPTSSAPTVARPVPAIASVPSTPTYSTPYTLPSAAVSVPPASTTSSSDDSDEGNSGNRPSDEEKSMEERYKSAISFGIGEGGDAGSGASDAASNTASLSYTAPSDRLLQAGTIIPAILFSGIDTANPGQVTAQVASDVYDNATDTNLLIPAGSQLIGSYNTTDANTGRVNVTFSTLVLPNGGSYAIGENIVAVDGQGYTGISGDVHHHRGANFANGIWNSALTALATLGVDNVTLDTSAFTNLTSQTKPTITIDPGYTFNLYVTAPIIF